MKMLIAVPCMDMIHTQFAHSLLSLKMNEETEVTFVASSLIYDSRNQILAKAIDGGYDRVLWSDSDMTFSQQTVDYLNQDLEAGYDIVSGLCFSRKPPLRPVCCKRCELVKHADGTLEPVSERWMDYPRDMLFEVAGVGFGFIMTRVDALRRISDKYGRMLFSPLPGFGEDLSFCIRARTAGERIWCDSRASVGHIGLTVFNEDLYLRGKDDGKH